MKKLTELAIILVLFGISSWAQEVRHEVTVQGSGFFNKQTTDGGITNEPTNSGGVMAGYRLNLKNWLAVEGDYDYFRNDQKFLANSVTTLIPMNVHAGHLMSEFLSPGRDSKKNENNCQFGQLLHLLVSSVIV